MGWAATLKLFQSAHRQLQGEPILAPVNFIITVTLDAGRGQDDVRDGSSIDSAAGSECDQGE